MHKVRIYPTISIPAAFLGDGRPMVKANRVLAIAVLAVALVFPVAQSFSDEASDIEAVDRVLEAEDVALELYKRALDRANKAVAASSLGKKAERLWDEFRAAMEAFEKTRAYREYLGSDKRPAGELFFLDLHYSHEESHEERMARRERYHCPSSYKMGHQSGLSIGGSGSFA